MKSFAKMLAAGLFITVGAGVTATAQAVNVDYDHTVNFLKYKSYKLASLHATDAGVSSRLGIALDRNLQARYLHVDSNNPDILVGVVEANQDKQEYSSFYDGLNGLDWKRGWGTAGFLDSQATIQDIAPGTLVIDMWDAKTKKLIWRGTITEPASVLSNKEADQKMDKAVGEVLAKFPPKFKK